jgi:hypothetical protein
MPMPRRTIHLLLGIAAAGLLTVAGATLAAAHDDHAELVGKTVTHDWTQNPYGADTPVPSYVTFFCDDTTLVWNAVTDPSDIRSGREAYTRTDLAPGIVQITWKESPETSNYGVIWTMKFDTMESFGVVVNAEPDANQILAGTLGLTEGLAPAEGLTGC